MSFSVNNNKNDILIQRVNLVRGPAPTLRLASAISCSARCKVRKKNIKAEGITITSNVTLGKDASDGYVLAINLDVTINGVETNVAKQIVEEAHQVYPYAKATRGNIEVVTNVVG